MNCPVCNAWTQILDTRKKPEGLVRRRRCGNDHTFLTVENVLKVIEKKKELQVEIEKQIPVPKKYPFHQMQVGDSFAVPPDIRRQTVSVAALRYGRNHGMKFVVRMMPDRSYRCWRIE